MARIGFFKPTRFRGSVHYNLFRGFKKTQHVKDYGHLHTVFRSDIIDFRSALDVILDFFLLSVFGTLPYQGFPANSWL